MKQELDKLVIMDHYKFPRNKENAPQEGAKVISGFNPGCGDKIELHLYEHDGVYNLFWKGEGCSICCATTSMMCELLDKKTKPEILATAKLYQDMILAREGDYTSLGDAQAMAGLSNFPSRFKCGSLAWQTLEQELNQK